MRARVKATGEILEVEEYHKYLETGWKYKDNAGMLYKPSALDFSDEAVIGYWTRLEHQYAGMAMQGILACEEWKISPREGVSFAGEVALQAHELAHSLVEKARYEENPKELEGLKKELEALKIEKTILDNKIKLLTEESK